MPKTAFWPGSLGIVVTKIFNFMHCESENSAVSDMLYLGINFFLSKFSYNYFLNVNSNFHVHQCIFFKFIFGIIKAPYLIPVRFFENRKKITILSDW